MFGLDQSVIGLGRRAPFTLGRQVNDYMKYGYVPYTVLDPSRKSYPRGDLFTPTASYLHTGADPRHSHHGLISYALLEQYYVVQDVIASYSIR